MASCAPAARASTCEPTTRSVRARRDERPTALVARPATRCTPIWSSATESPSCRGLRAGPAIRRVVRTERSPGLPLARPGEPPHHEHRGERHDEQQRQQPRMGYRNVRRAVPMGHVRSRRSQSGVTATPPIRAILASAQESPYGGRLASRGLEAARHAPPSRCAGLGHIPGARHTGPLMLSPETKASERQTARPRPSRSGPYARPSRRSGCWPDVESVALVEVGSCPKPAPSARTYCGSGVARRKPLTNVIPGALAAGSAHDPLVCRICRKAGRRRLGGVLDVPVFEHRGRRLSSIAACGAAAPPLLSGGWPELVCP